MKKSSASRNRKKETKEIVNAPQQTKTNLTPSSRGGVGKSVDKRRLMNCVHNDARRGSLRSGKLAMIAYVRPRRTGRLACVCISVRIIGIIIVVDVPPRLPPLCPSAPPPPLPTPTPSPLPPPPSPSSPLATCCRNSRSRRRLNVRRRCLCISPPPMPLPVQTRCLCISPGTAHASRRKRRRFAMLAKARTVKLASVCIVSSLEASFTCCRSCHSASRRRHRRRRCRRLHRRRCRRRRSRLRRLRRAAEIATAAAASTLPPPLPLPVLTRCLCISPPLLPQPVLTRCLRVSPGTAMPERESTAGMQAPVELYMLRC